MGHPMLGDVEAAGDPDPPEATNVVQQPLKPRRSGGVAHDAHVQADRQHFWVGLTFVVQHVEGVSAVVEEVVAGGEGTSAEF